MTKKVLILCAACTLLFAGCSKKDPDKSVKGTGDKLTIFVTVMPQAGIVKQIGGKFVDVKVLVSSGSCPETFSPSPKQISALYDADIFLSLGLPFEDTWLKKISGVHTGVNIRPMTEGIRFRELEGHSELDDHDDVGHGEKHEHKKGDKDPHVWMSIRNAQKMAQNTAKIFSELMPANSVYFMQNLKTFSAKTTALDNELKKKFSSAVNKNIFVFHPVFGYLADDYGLRQIPIEMEGKEPSAKQLTEIIQTFKRYNAKMIFVQPEFNPKTAEAVARELNAQIVPISIYNEDVSQSIEELVKKGNL
jgi:zinc transport system substrate-binding protein